MLELAQSRYEDEGEAVLQAALARLRAEQRADKAVLEKHQREAA